MLTLLIASALHLPLAGPQLAPAPSLPHPLIVPGGAFYPPGIGLYGSCWTLSPPTYTPNGYAVTYSCAAREGDDQCAVAGEFVFGLEKYLWEDVGTCNGRACFVKETDTRTGANTYTLLGGVVIPQGPAAPDELAAYAERMAADPQTLPDQVQAAAAPTGISVGWDADENLGFPVSLFADCFKATDNPRPHGVIETRWYCWFNTPDTGCAMAGEFQRNGRRYSVHTNASCTGQLMGQHWKWSADDPTSWRVVLHNATVVDIGEYP